jgi:hypothetical protein
MTSWEVRLATLLAWLGVLPGVGCLALSAKAFSTTDDMLLFVMPIIACAALVAGLVIIGGAAGLAVRLKQQHPAARLQALLAGASMAVCGLFMVSFTRVGVLLLLYGGLLAWLVCTPGAGRDLGPFRRAVQQPAPWGSRPGTGLWKPAEPPAAPWAARDPEAAHAPVQGPWAPDPRTIPWFSWKGYSGPRVPWWQTWQAGLAQGIPLWELVLLCLAMLGFLCGLVVIPFVLGGSAYLGTLHLTGGRVAFLLLLLPASWAVVAWLEMRMRTRLAIKR